MSDRTRSGAWWLLFLWSSVVCIAWVVGLVAWLAARPPVFLLLGAGYGLFLAVMMARMAAILFPSWRVVDRYPLLFPMHRPEPGGMPPLAELGLLLVVLTGFLAMFVGAGRQWTLNFIFLCLGVTMMMRGNYLSRATPKDNLTTRTRWTRADPEVWRRTHRFAGKLYFATGAVFCVLALFMSSRLVPILVVVGCVLAIGVLARMYSHRIYLRIHGGVEPLEEEEFEDRLKGFARREIRRVRARRRG